MTASAAPGRLEERDRIYTIRLPEAEIAGRIKKRTGRGVTIEMLRPYVGLTTVVPAAAISDSNVSDEKQISATLLLLYKKARYYLKNRERILALHEELLYKLSENSFDKTRKNIMARFERRKEELERKRDAHRISGEQYRDAVRKSKKRMIQSLTKLYRAEHTLEEKVFGGILKLSDVSAFIEHFTPPEDGTSPAAEKPHKQRHGQQHDKDEKENTSHSGGDLDDTSETEQSGDKRDYQKNQSPA